MIKSFPNLKKQIIVFLTFLLLFSSFIYSQTENKDSNNKDPQPAKLEMLDETDFKTFSNMLDNNASYSEQIKYLNEWEKRSPDNPDLLLCYYLSNITMAVDDISYFDKAISYLEKAVSLYPDRADIWDALLTGYSFIPDYESVENAAKRFFKQIEVNGNNWYVSHNYKLDFQTENEKNEFMFKLISELTNSWLNNYPSIQAVICTQHIWQELLAYTPSNLLIYAELGKALIYTNPYEAFFYLEIVHNLIPENLTIIFNLCLCSLYANDMEKYDKYFSLLLDSGEEKYIQLMIDNKKQFDEMNNN